jgi:RND superfamily putative drug exporter
VRKLARFVLKHRRPIVAAWVVIFFAGITGVGKSVDRLSTNFSPPGQPGYETATRVPHTYGRSIFDSADGRTAFAYAFIPEPNGFTDAALPELETALSAAAPTGTSAVVTGVEALATGGSPNTGPGVLAETFIGGVGALAVLLFVFASFLALLPLIIAAIAILSTFLVVLGLTYLTDISFIVEFLVALVGLGVAVDYSLTTMPSRMPWRPRAGPCSSAAASADPGPRKPSRAAKGRSG